METREFKVVLTIQVENQSITEEIGPSIPLLGDDKEEAISAAALVVFNRLKEDADYYIIRDMIAVSFRSI